MTVLVAGRLLQGLVSGPMVALAQALLLRAYPATRRGVALAIWGMVVVVAPIFGPVLGGWITDNFSWPWLFYINVPIGLLAAAVSWALLHKRETERVRVPVDVVGIVLLFVGVGALQFMLDNGNEHDWFSSPLILTTAVVAVVCLVYLVAWELTDRHPIIDIHLFQIRNFSVACVLTFCAFFSFFGATILISPVARDDGRLHGHLGRPVHGAVRPDDAGTDADPRPQRTAAQQARHDHHRASRSSRPACGGCRASANIPRSGNSRCHA
jgi:DHA2 family multidrug resistance protein